VNSMEPTESATTQTIQEMVAVEEREKIGISLSDRIANWISALAGSMLFAWFHVAWFAAWILLNTITAGTRFDAYPFGLLTMIVSLEAIFLSTFVLISQNRQSLLAERRSQVDLQVNLISELEVTKVMALVSEIHQHLGLSDGPDIDVRRMQRATHVEELADEVDAAEQAAGKSAAR
jgi:uncharacterized membrane protein